MTVRVLDEARALLDAAAAEYHDDAEALRQLHEHATRLDEPLRVAIAGMVKAGKSTLLNAIIGEEIAPTDAGECTKVITWYRHGATPRITMHLRAGGTRSLPVRRDDGQLVIDLGATPADDVERIDVEWPSKRLEDVTLIDTPGIASLSTEISARSAAFLTPVESPSEADAIIYLMRHLHSADLGFLSAFHDTSVGRSATVNAMAVLSRADEIGAGRIDALLSARTIAERYRTDGAAALARPRRRSDRRPGGRSRRARCASTSSTRSGRSHDSDARPGSGCWSPSTGSCGRMPRSTCPPRIARACSTGSGMFGIRMSAVAIRSGYDDSTDLADELYRRSGMEDLLRLVSDQFRSRADALKARTALAAISALSERRPRQRPGLARAVERLEANAHELRELSLLAAARTTGIGLLPRNRRRPSG